MSSLDKSYVYIMYIPCSTEEYRLWKCIESYYVGVISSHNRNVDIRIIAAEINWNDDDRSNGKIIINTEQRGVR